MPLKDGLAYTIMYLNQQALRFIGEHKHISQSFGNLKFRRGDIVGAGDSEQCRVVRLHCEPHCFSTCLSMLQLIRKGKSR